MKGRSAAAILCLAPVLLFAQAARSGADDAGRYGQALADALRTAASAPIAFVPSGMLKDSLTGKDLAASLEFPEEELAVVKITGAQVRQALERSLSLYPNKNPGFLHISGIEVTFNPSAAVDKRIVSVTVGGAALDAAAEYRVAMPASVARGGLGYFTVWTKTALENQTTRRTLESLVKGVQPAASPSRWKPASGLVAEQAAP